MVISESHNHNQLNCAKTSCYQTEARGNSSDKNQEIHSVSIDALKGWLMMLVVIGHILERMRGNFDISRQLYMFIYFFHMPVFVIVTGYLSKLGSGNAAFKKQFSKIFLPFLIFQFIFLLIFFLYHPFTLKDLIQKGLTPQYSLWYLFCLFFWRLILPYWLKLPHFLLLAICIGLFGGFLPLHYGQALSLSRMLAFFPYFIFGYYLANYTKIKQNSLDKFNHTGSCTKILSMVILMFAMFAAIILNGKYQDSFLHIKFYAQMNQTLWISLMFRAIAYVTSVFVGFSFFILIPKTLTSVIKIGKNSLYVYLLHSIPLYYLLQTQQMENIADLKIFWLTVLLGIPFVFLLSSDITKRITTPLVEPITLIKNRSLMFL
jgi:fucose 4-O-acetylase-like acetyltransferase